ncbi:MAG TPA: hypothetical protein ACFYD3_00390 [Candidatus Hypogeohydataceae bacterium YC41]
MLAKTKAGELHKKRKLARLALIKERYRKLVLEPRKEVAFELDKDLEEEENFHNLSYTPLR